VALVGAADHGLPDCAPGTYRSRVVVRAGDPARGLGDLRGRTVAINSDESQSGAGALRAAVLPLAPDGCFFGTVVATGSHAGSVRAVAEGRADAAAVDAVTWEMACRYLPEARALRVLLSTPETPGLPFVTRPDGPAPAILAALREAVEAVGPEARAALMLRSVVPRREADFDAIAAADAAARPLAPS
jgi:ABC-type phosphate/phosphonate transport system substrate-binding protein